MEGAEQVAPAVLGRGPPDEFRTAPLWGIGRRILFLHDGRTGDLLEAIQAHKSAANGLLPAWEANAVIDAFNALRMRSNRTFSIS